MRIIKPKKLLKGDVIGLIAPGSNVDDPAILAKSWLDVRPDQRSSTEDIKLI